LSPPPQRCLGHPLAYNYLNVKAVLLYLRPFLVRIRVGNSICHIVSHAGLRGCKVRSVSLLDVVKRRLNQTKLLERATVVDICLSVCLSNACTLTKRNNLI